MLRARKTIIVLESSLAERRARHAESRVLLEFPDQKSEVISLKGDVRVEVADNIILQTGHSGTTRVECMDLTGEVALGSLGHADQFKPRKSRGMLPHQLIGAVGRTVTDDHPSQ